MIIEALYLYPCTDEDELWNLGLPSQIWPWLVHCVTRVGQKTTNLTNSEYFVAYHNHLTTNQGEIWLARMNLRNFAFISAHCYPCKVRNINLMKFGILGPPILTHSLIGGKLVCKSEAMLCCSLPNFTTMPCGARNPTFGFILQFNIL